MDRVARALDGLSFCTEHVGSTAIPGCAAKPIVDLVVVVGPPDKDEAISRLAAAGYVHKGDGGITGRERFAQPGDLPRHHLYLCSAGNRELEREILFRDYLRSHPEQILNYSRLKIDLAARYRDDRQAYTRAKTPFIEGILSLAGRSRGEL